MPDSKVFAADEIDETVKTDESEDKPFKLKGSDKWGFRISKQHNYSVVTTEVEFEDSVENEFSISVVEMGEDTLYDVGFDMIDSGIFSAEDLCKIVSLMVLGLQEATGKKLIITEDGRVEIIPF